jgi:hypothetical protein
MSSTALTQAPTPREGRSDCDTGARASEEGRGGIAE